MKTFSLYRIERKVNVNDITNVIFTRVDEKLYSKS